MKTKAINQLTSALLALFVFVMFALSACSSDDSGDDPSDPTSIIISKITVTDFPEFKGEVPHLGIPIYWDPVGISGAEIYPSIKQGSKTILTCVDDYKKNADCSRSHAFIIKTVVNLNLTETYTIRLHDWDSENDDLIGETSFKPYNGVDTPNQLLISGGGVSWTIDVEYSY